MLEVVVIHEKFQGQTNKDDNLNFTTYIVCFSVIWSNMCDSGKKIKFYCRSTNFFANSDWYYWRHNYKYCWEKELIICSNIY